ncbi:MAG: proline dehydrogenase, partial [Candidatus Azotimanducaceae bacterium]
MLSFENTEIAFQSRSTRDLNRAFFLFNMVKHPWIVKTGKIITEFALNIGLPINGIIKKTVFNHFCGGETITDCKSTIDELHQFGIGTILDYSVEAKANEADFESCLEQTLSAIAMAKENPDSIPFCVFKPTGLGPFSLWEKFSTDLEKSPEEQKAFQKVCTRVNTICKAAYNAHTPILIDAEESWIQLAVDRISDEMMQAYNTDRAIVYNTVQLYRHGRLAYLKDSIEKAKTKGYYYGVKTVRGAYMEKERERAIRLNYNSP